jgi:DtxR family Mn-dependent transcriptional regulator
MLRTLAESQLADYQSHKGVRLTDAGNKLALRVLRRHRLVELFLVQTLGLAWDEVHEEAEHLEHVVSERLIDRMDEYLNFPERDPHGDPIPTSEGTVSDASRISLVDCPLGAKFQLDRVLDQSPEFLRYLGQAGLEFGSTGTIEEKQEHAGALIVRTATGAALLLGTHAAEKIRVTLAPPTPVA